MSGRRQATRSKTRQTVSGVGILYLLLLPLSAQARPAILDGAVENGDGWMFSNWLGHVQVAADPWLYSPDLGWFYAEEAEGDAYWAYLAGCDAWIYTSRSIFPFGYADRNGWLYFVADGEETWFYVYDTNDWVLRA